MADPSPAAHPSVARLRCWLDEADALHFGGTQAGQRQLLAAAQHLQRAAASATIMLAADARPFDRNPMRSAGVAAIFTQVHLAREDAPAHAEDLFLEWTDAMLVMRLGTTCLSRFVDGCLRMVAGERDFCLSPCPFDGWQRRAEQAGGPLFVWFWGDWAA
jgi:hypothetical protein